MIDLHYWTTPNGHKITMFLEETGLPYRIVPVNLVKDEQFAPDFLAIAPNNKMPAIVDHDPIGGGAPMCIHAMVEPGKRARLPIGRSYPGFRREAVNRSRIAKTRGKAMKFTPGDMLPTTVMEAVTGRP